jgi:hypothetical protein
MTQAEISGISPFFIVHDVAAALAFYRDRLGFEITFQGPTANDLFFGIVRRGGAMIMLKDIGVDPLPNYKRDVKKVSPAGTLISISRILMHWRPNLRRAMSSFPSH